MAQIKEFESEDFLAAAHDCDDLFSQASQHNDSTVRRIEFSRDLRNLLRRTLTLPFVFALALIAITTVELGYLRSIQSWVFHSSKVLSHAEHLKMFANDAQTDIRGYELSGSEELKGSALGNQNSFQKELLKIRQLVADSPEQTKHINLIGQTFMMWLDFIDHQPLPALDPFEREKSFKLFNNMNNEFRAKTMTAFDRFMEAEKDIREQRLAKMNAIFHYLLLTICILAVLVAVVSAWLGRNAIVHISSNYARALNRSEKATAVRDEFLSVASHELKTPLTAVKLQLQVLQRRLRSGQEKHVEVARVKESLDVSIRQINALGRLIDELMDASRITAGKLGLQYSEMDLANLVRDVVARFSVQLQQAQCEPKFDLSTGIIGHWDSFRMEQVVANLLTNAIKYAPGAPILISAKKEGTQAILSVRDFGPGIAESMQVRIFERFQQLRSAQTVGGLGLGLFIVKNIVTGMGGRIWVESKEGEGANFLVSLPLTPPA